MRNRTCQRQSGRIEKGRKERRRGGTKRIGRRRERGRDRERDMEQEREKSLCKIETGNYSRRIAQQVGPQGTYVRTDLGK